MPCIVRCITVVQILEQSSPFLRMIKDEVIMTNERMSCQAHVMHVKCVLYCNLVYSYLYPCVYTHMPI